MITAYNNPLFSFTAVPTGGVPTSISYGLRVGLGLVGNTTCAIVQDNTARGIGSTLQDTPAGASNIALYSWGPGTRNGVLTAGPVTYGNTLYAAAGGMVAPTGTVIVGVSLSTESTNGALIEYDAQASG